MKNQLFLFVSLFPFLLSAQSNKQNQTSWQQKSNHTINVVLDIDSNKYFLNATQKVVYFNNSPDTLDRIIFHLWPNAYKNRQTPYAKQQAALGKKDFLTKKLGQGYIEVSNVMVGNKVKTNLQNSQDEIATLFLEKPLFPGDSVEVFMDFKVKMPKVFSRLGAENDFIAATQWYPKPAVYDVNGWNPMPYLEQGEFYSEFGDYLVNITVPADFVVAATGQMQSEQEEAYLNSLELFYKTNPTRKKHKITYDNEQVKPLPPYTSKFKTIQFTQENVHDFAWFSSPDFGVYTETITLDSNHQVLNRLFTRQNNMQALNGLEYMKQALIFYSENVGMYPYKTCSVVIGDLIAGGGMEYPTITVCQSINAEVIVHELGHNWFYGIVASNERRWPWMDESVNTYFENQFFKKQNNQNDFAVLQGMAKRKKSALLQYYVQETYRILNLNAQRLGEDQHSCKHSQDYLSNNYFAVIYGRTATHFEYLESFLGTEMFQKCMKEYYQQFKFKHPLPYDMQNTFEKTSGKNLDWFFETFLHNEGGVDFKAKVNKTNELFTEIKITNKTRTEIPLAVASFELQDTAMPNMIFLNPFEKDTIVNIANNATVFRLDPLYKLPDYKYSNNQLLLGPSVKNNNYKLTLLPTPENPFFNEVYLNPAVNYTSYSGWGFGASVFNRLYPFKKFEYDFTAYYGTRTKNMIGNGSIGWNFPVYKNKFLQRINVNLGLSRYDYKPDGISNTFNKINPSITFYLKHKGTLSNKVQKRLRMEYMYIYSDKQYAEISDSTRREFKYPVGGQFAKINYEIYNKHGLHPSKLNFIVESGIPGKQQSQYTGAFAKAEIRTKFSRRYNSKDRKFRGEFNTGMFLYHQANVNPIYTFQLSGNNGLYDYTFNETLLGRSQDHRSGGLWSQQLINAGGDMRTPIGTALNNELNGYSSLKLESSLPFMKTVRVFADFGIGFTNPQELLWVGGVSLILIEDVFEIYVPLMYSNQFRKIIDLNQIKPFQTMAFKLDLNYFYPRKNVEKFRRLFNF